MFGLLRVRLRWASPSVSGLGASTNEPDVFAIRFWFVRDAKKQSEQSSAMAATTLSE
jgi:hypothetical protein